MAASRANRLRLCWRPTQQRLTDRLQRYEQLDYTYVEVGATCAASLPAGYHHIDHSTIAGTGHKTFALLAKALWGWQLQRCAGLVVATSHDTVTIGVTVLNAIPGRPGLVAPCRVVESSMTPAAWLLLRDAARSPAAGRGTVHGGVRRGRKGRTAHRVVQRANRTCPARSAGGAPGPAGPQRSVCRGSLPHRRAPRSTPARAPDPRSADDYPSRPAGRSRPVPRRSRFDGGDSRHPRGARRRWRPSGRAVASSIPDTWKIGRNFGRNSADSPARLLTITARDEL